MVSVFPVHENVTLPTSRIEVMAEWYELVLGLHVDGDPPERPGVRLVEADRSITLVPPTENAPPIGTQTVESEFASELDLMLGYLRLQARGVVPAQVLKCSTGFVLTYRDPDGNVVGMRSFPRSHVVLADDLVPVDLDRIIAEKSRSESLAWFGRSTG
jgi:hypothetical protein